MSNPTTPKQLTTGEFAAKKKDITSRYQLVYEEFTFHQQAVNAATRQMRSAESRLKAISQELFELTQKTLAL